MDFDDTPEEAAFRAEAYAWLSANADLRTGEDEAPLSTDDPDYLKLGKAWQARKAEAGWACISWPKEYGGRGASIIESLIWAQEESKFHLPASIFHVAHSQAGPTVMRHGAEDQKKRWLPKMISGQEIWCQLFSEPDAGSDLAGLRTRAIPDGDQWIINGQKTWTSGANWSDWGILIARTDTSVPKHKGLTYFVCDMKDPGLTIRPIKQIWGSSDFSEVFINDVSIPDANRISDPGSGWSVAMTTLANERAAVSGGTVGPGGERLPTPVDILELAKKCRIGGRFALESESVREKIADYFVRWKGLEYTSYRILTSLSRGEAPGGEGSIGKLVEGGMQQEMGALALDLLAASNAVAEENGVQEFEKWQFANFVASAIRIAGGTDEILRNIIAERVLGLPAEPRIDKAIPFSEVPRNSRMV